MSHSYLAPSPSLPLSQAAPSSPRPASTPYPRPPPTPRPPPPAPPPSPRSAPTRTSPSPRAPPPPPTRPPRAPAPADPRATPPRDPSSPFCPSPPPPRRLTRVSVRLAGSPRPSPSSRPPLTTPRRTPEASGRQTRRGRCCIRSVSDAGCIGSGARAIICRVRRVRRGRRPRGSRASWAPARGSTAAWRAENSRMRYVSDSDSYIHIDCFILIICSAHTSRCVLVVLSSLPTRAEKMNVLRLPFVFVGPLFFSAQTPF